MQVAYLGYFHLHREFLAQRAKAMGMSFVASVGEQVAADIAVIEWSSNENVRTDIERLMVNRPTGSVIVLTPLGCPDLVDRLPYAGKYRCVTIPLKAEKLEEALRYCTSALGDRQAKASQFQQRLVNT